MTQLTALRLYFPMSARAKATRFWHKLSAPTLGHHILRCAKRAHIQQATMLMVQAGYLPGEKLEHWHLENPTKRLPQCIELIDSESKLRRFLHDHADELKEVRPVLYHCEVPVNP